MVKTATPSKATNRRSSKKRNGDEGEGKRRPVVFMFQPTEFLPVKPRKMKEWEEGLKAAIGPGASKVHQLMKAGGFLETTSICVPGGNDDCDVFEGDVLSF